MIELAVVYVIATIPELMPALKSGEIEYAHARAHLSTVVDGTTYHI